jgi:hypothetical protein
MVLTNEPAGTLLPSSSQIMVSSRRLARLPENPGEPGPARKRQGHESSGLNRQISNSPLTISK